MKTGFASGVALLIFSVCLSPNSSLAALNYYEIYNGNGVAGSVGSGALALTNNQYTVSATFKNGMGSFQDNLVIFIDCAPGGFTSTSPFNDKASPLETAISGVNVSRSTANFATGFEADYAIALGVNNGSALYKLVLDSTGPHLQLVRSSLNLQPTDNLNRLYYTFQFDWIDIGLPNLRTNFFKFETSYIANNGFRTLESFEYLTGQTGFDTITFTNYDTYGVPPVPEPANAALAVFGSLAVIVTLGSRARHYFGKF